MNVLWQLQFEKKNNAVQLMHYWKRQNVSVSIYERLQGLEFLRLKVIFIEN